MVLLRSRSRNIWEYPNCDSLIHMLTLVLEGALVMADMPQEQKERYEEELLSWYERSAHSEEEAVRNGALFLLAGKYLKKKESGKAQEMIDLLPERSALDKRLLQASVYMAEEETREAAKLMERVLLTAVNDANNALIGLASIEQAAGEVQTAHKIADISEQFAELFCMWGYNPLIAHAELAIAEKNIGESIRLLRQMLEYAFLPWKVQQSPLYHRIYQKMEETHIWKKIQPPLLANLEGDPKYDFLRENREFQALLAEYRARCEKIEEISE